MSTLFNFDSYQWYVSSRVSSVSIATRYGLDGLRFEPRFRRDFLYPSRPTPRPTQSPVRWVSGLFPRGKAAGALRWCCEWVGLYICSPILHVVGWPLLYRRCVNLTSHESGIDFIRHCWFYKKIVQHTIGVDLSRYTTFIENMFQCDKHLTKVLEK